MSRFGTGERAGRTIRSGTPSVPLTGTTETLDAPGLAFQSPSTNNDFAQLSALLGEIGQTANAVAGYESNRQAEQRRLEAEQERQAYLAEQEAKKSEQARRGLVAEKAQPIVAEYGAMLQAGTLDVRGKTLDQVVGEIIAIRWQGVTDPVVLDEARQQVQSGLAAEYQTRLARTAAEAEIQLGKGEAARVFAAPDSIASVVEQRKARNPGMQEADVYVPVYEAAQRMAREGSANFESTLNALPDSSYSVEKSALRAQYQAAKSNQTTLRRQAAEDTIGTYRYQKNYPVALSALQGFVDSGTIDGEKANTIRKGIEEEQAKELNLSKAAVRQAEDNQIKSDYLAGVASATDAGLPFAVQDLKVDVPQDDGTTREVAMTRKEAIDTVMQRRLAPSGGFPAVTTENIAYAADRNYAVPQWKDLFSQASLSISAYGLDLKDGKLIDQASKNVVASFTAYKQMRAMDRSAYMTSLMDDKTIAVFEIAARNQQLVDGPGGGNQGADSQAIISAIRQYNNPREVDTKKLASAISDLGPGSFRRFFTNEKEMENADEVVSALAPVVAMKSNISQDDAIEQAIKEYGPRLVAVNGFYHLAQPDLPGGMRENMGKIFDVIADEYLAKYEKKKAGISKDVLTLRPDPSANVWHLVKKNSNGFAPYDDTKDVTFSYTDLGKAYGRWADRKRKTLLSESPVTAQDIAGFGVTP